MGIRRAKGAILSIALGMGVIIGAGTALPAAAAVADPLLVSHDGVNFSPGSDVDLFADIDRVVPGDTVTERVWLHNDTQDAGVLRLLLVDVATTDVDLAEATDLAFADASGVEIGRLTVAEAVTAGSCISVADVVLEPGETLRLDTDLSVDTRLGSASGDDGTDGARGSVAFQLRATLSDAEAGAGAPVECDPPDARPPGELPATGGVLNMTALVVALGLLGAGAAFTVLTRTGRARE